MGDSRIEMRVEVYSKPQCSLCERAKEWLTLARATVGFELIEYDIYDRADSFARYRYDIPVVLIEGREALRLNFTQAELMAALTAAAPATLEKKP